MSTFSLSSGYHHTIVNYTLRRLNVHVFNPRTQSVSNESQIHPKKHQSYSAKDGTLRATPPMASISSGNEVLTPALDSSSDPPPIFDGTPKLYISYSCPYAQRVWITRNCKGLIETIKLVPIDLKNRPAWYKEKVYPENKVPALEHNNKVMGESLELIRYIDNNFEGPSLFPEDPARAEFAEELLSYVGSFCKAVTNSLKAKEVNEASKFDYDNNNSFDDKRTKLISWQYFFLHITGGAFDEFEIALSKFDDGPFFLGHFSLVDIAYAPFVERFQPFLLQVMSYDVTTSRPRLAVWIQEMNKIEGYKETQRDPKEHIESYKKRFSLSSL